MRTWPKVSEENSQSGALVPTSRPSVVSARVGEE